MSRQGCIKLPPPPGGNRIKLLGKSSGEEGKGKGKGKGERRRDWREEGRGRGKKGREAKR